MTASASKKLVLLAGQGESTRILFHALDTEFPIAKVIVEDPVPRGEFLKKRATRLGWGTVAGQLAFQAYAKLALRPLAMRRINEIKKNHRMDASPIDSTRLHHVHSVNDDETIELLKSINPDLVVINGTRILSEKVLDCVPCRFINTHAGITPLYRGVHGGYWALAQGQPKACGVTVHLVDRGVDTGGILFQETITPAAADSFVTYPYLQLARAIPLLRTAIHNSLGGHHKTKSPPAGESRLWSHPTLWGYLWRRVRQGVR